MAFLISLERLVNSFSLSLARSALSKSSSLLIEVTRFVFSEIKASSLTFWVLSVDISSERDFFFPEFLEFPYLIFDKD